MKTTFKKLLYSIYDRVRTATFIEIFDIVTTELLITTAVALITSGSKRVNQLIDIEVMTAFYVVATTICIPIILKAIDKVKMHLLARQPIEYINDMRFATLRILCFSVLATVVMSLLSHSIGTWIIILCTSLVVFLLLTIIVTVMQVRSILKRGKDVI